MISSCLSCAFTSRFLVEGAFLTEDFETDLDFTALFGLELLRVEVGFTGVFTGLLSC